MCFCKLHTTWKYPNIRFFEARFAISLPKLPTMDPPIRSKAYLDRSKRSAPDVNWLCVHKYDISWNTNHWYSSKRLDTIWCQWKLSINPFCQQLKNKKMTNHHLLRIFFVSLTSGTYAEVETSIFGKDLLVLLSGGLMQRRTVLSGCIAQLQAEQLNQKYCNSHHLWTIVVPNRFAIGSTILVRFTNVYTGQN